jgi:hypothetical protein
LTFLGHRTFIFVNQATTGGKPYLIVGSSNIIGESYNPMEFYPSAADLASAGGEAQYAAASAELVASMEKYTVAHALEHCGANTVLAPFVNAYVAKVRLQCAVRV